VHTLTDVLIAGGGLAGSAAAIQLARIGFSVELFERASFPRKKPCGEGLMPAGVAALERIGLNASAGAPFRGIRWHFRERVAEGRFPDLNGVPSLGRGLRRRDLDRALFELAAETRNVTVHTRAPVEAPLMERGRVVGLIVNGSPGAEGWSSERTELNRGCAML
jgi:2-polyprenyl-6-methoxyphenol hydroxylase-like FAD-dependent oxidoreductase